MFSVLDRVQVRDSASSRYDGCFGFITNVFIENGQMIDATVNVEDDEGRVTIRYYAPHDMVKVEELDRFSRDRSAQSEERAVARRHGGNAGVTRFNEQFMPREVAPSLTPIQPYAPPTLRGPSIRQTIQRAQAEQDSVAYWGGDVAPRGYGTAARAANQPMLTQEDIQLAINAMAGYANVQHMPEPEPPAEMMALEVRPSDMEVFYHSRRYGDVSLSELGVLASPPVQEA